MVHIGLVYSRKTQSASRMTKSASAYNSAGASRNESLYYFDSYGTPVQQQVIDKYKYIRAKDYKIQPLNSSMCGQLSLLVIYLLTNGFKYEDVVNSLKMTSNFISTDIAGNVLGNGNSNENNRNYSTKLQNDIQYINTTGDTLTGDLNLNGNKLYFNDNKRTIDI